MAQSVQQQPLVLDFFPPQQYYQPSIMQNGEIVLLPVTKTIEYNRVNPYLVYIPAQYYFSPDPTVFYSAAAAQSLQQQQPLDLDFIPPQQCYKPTMMQNGEVFLVPVNRTIEYSRINAYLVCIPTQYCFSADPTAFYSAAEAHQQQPAAGYPHPQPPQVPTSGPTIVPAAAAQSLQQQQPGPHPQPPQDPTSGIERPEPFVQPILRPTIVPATSSVVSDLRESFEQQEVKANVPASEVFDQQEVKDIINILRMNLDIIYELRRMFHGRVPVSTDPFKALSEKSSEFTLEYVIVEVVEAGQRALAKRPTNDELAEINFLKDYGIPESHRSFVNKFILEPVMKHYSWFNLIFMSIYFDLAPPPSHD